MYKSAKKGWYKLLNPNKFIKPIDEHMKSFKDNSVNYKSSLELSAIRYCDYNNNITKWSLEPFAIKYLKITDMKMHRYYVDLFIEFKNGQKFLVEIKSKGETIAPRKPTKCTPKAMNRYNKSFETFIINSSKWEAAKKFAELNKMKFIILTEDELK